MHDKVITVILLSYNSDGKLQRAIDSVLEQTYPAIELIVADDGSSGFRADLVEHYIARRKRDNLRRYVVLHAAENVGTVRNLRRAFQAYTGQYHMILGADDKLRYPKVLEDFARTFEEYHDEPYLVCANAGMFTIRGKFMYPMIQPATVAVIRRANADELFAKLTHHCLLLTVATCYRREFLDIVGLPDTAYTLLEDWPAFLSMASQGIVPVYLDRMVTSHTIGGIANGAVGLPLAKVNALFADRQRLFDQYARPQFHRLPPEDQAAFLQRQAHERRRQYCVTVWNRLSPGARLLAALRRREARQLLLEACRALAGKASRLLVRTYKKSLAGAALALALSLLVSAAWPPHAPLAQAVAAILALGFFLLAAAGVFGYAAHLYKENA